MLIWGFPKEKPGQLILELIHKKEMCVVYVLKLLQKKNFHWGKNIKEFVLIVDDHWIDFGVLFLQLFRQNKLKADCIIKLNT